MRAAVLREHRFTVEEVATPAPGPADVLVKVRSCGICGSDLHYVHHIGSIIEKARSLGAPTDELERSVSQGVVLGHEFVGEIVSFGEAAAKTLKLGTRVCSVPFVLKGGAPVLIGSNPETTGAYAEYMTLTEANLVPVPDEVSDEAAALTEPLGIAVHAVNKASMLRDAAAAVVGCGPIGLTVIAVLKARGVKHIIASDLSPKRRALALSMGASVVVDGRTESVITAAAGAAGAAPLVVFENTGAPGMLYRLILEAPQNARIVVTGIAAGDESILPMLAITKELSIQFVIYYAPDEFAGALEMIRRDALDWRKLVTGKVGLDGIPQAFDDLTDPERHAKILIDPWAR